MLISQNNHFSLYYLNNFHSQDNRDEFEKNLDLWYENEKNKVDAGIALNRIKQVHESNLKTLDLSGLSIKSLPRFIPDSVEILHLTGCSELIKEEIVINEEMIDKLSCSLSTSAILLFIAELVTISHYMLLQVALETGVICNHRGYCVDIDEHRMENIMNKLSLTEGFIEFSVFCFATLSLIKLVISIDFLKEKFKFFFGEKLKMANFPYAHKNIKKIYIGKTPIETTLNIEKKNSQAEIDVLGCEKIKYISNPHKITGHAKTSIGKMLAQCSEKIEPIVSEDKYINPICPISLCSISDVIFLKTNQKMASGFEVRSLIEQTNTKNMKNPLNPKQDINEKNIVKYKDKDWSFSFQKVKENDYEAVCMKHSWIN